MKKVWFIADLHIGHKKILEYHNERADFMHLKNRYDINEHDEYIINMWLNTVSRGDVVYVLGDFILNNAEYTNKVLNKLKSNGCKIHLIVGNHDKSTLKFPNMFESISYIKDVIFKKNEFNFLNEDFKCVLCHYPMKTWSAKPYGSMQLYGHVHNEALWIDEQDDLCLNVGIDNPLLNGKLISLEDVYSYYLKKLNQLNPVEYNDNITLKNKFYIR